MKLIDWLTKIDFKKFGLQLTTHWGWDAERHWSPYQTIFAVGRLRVHCFHRGDGDPDPHDHPWEFWTYPLTSYIETYYVGPKCSEYEVKRFRIHHRPAEYVHRLNGKSGGYNEFLDVGYHNVVPGRIWSIVWLGKKSRDWGFWVPDGPFLDGVGQPRKMVPWRDYVYGR